MGGAQDRFDRQCCCPASAKIGDPDYAKAHWSSPWQHTSIVLARAGGGHGGLASCAEVFDDSSFDVLAGTEGYAPAHGPGRPTAAREEAPCFRHYREWSSIREALESTDTVLIRGSWIEERFLAGALLPRRQELPQDAIWDVEELMRDVEEQNRPTPQILSISYSWLSREHPDPDGFHMRTFCPLLKHFARHMKLGVENLAVFIDWCSLPQHPRSSQEDVSFQRALEHVHLWYTHWLTEVWLATGTPKGVVPYKDRGWTSFERAVSNMIIPIESVLDLGLLRPGWRSWGQVVKDCRARRRPPAVPETFVAELQRKAFTKGSDRSFVTRRYAETFREVMGSANLLSFGSLGWGDRDVQRLAEVLPLCGSLRQLELHRNAIGGGGALALEMAIPSCGALQRLGLDDNRIDDIGVTRLREAWIKAGKPEEGLELRSQRPVPRQGPDGLDAELGPPIPGLSRWTLRQACGKLAALEAAAKANQNSPSGSTSTDQQRISPSKDDASATISRRPSFVGSGNLELDLRLIEGAASPANRGAAAALGMASAPGTPSELGAMTPGRTPSSIMTPRTPKTPGGTLLRSPHGNNGKQLSALLARQEAFEARVDAAVARMKAGLEGMAAVIDPKSLEAPAAAKPAPAPAPPVPEVVETAKRTETAEERAKRLEAEVEKMDEDEEESDVYLESFAVTGVWVPSVPGSTPSTLRRQNAAEFAREQGAPLRRSNAVDFAREEVASLRPSNDVDSMDAPGARKGLQL
mmetsp:Transcript_116896/g.261135  ORF Transcript_116896/g.261135 Transcript_116896/m.261135 type:complete len:751 (-) Transcript_116896:63-2315(-)